MALPGRPWISTSRSPRPTGDSRALLYATAALFFLGFAGKGVRAIFGEIGSLIPMGAALAVFVVVFRRSGARLTLRRFPTTISLFVAWCACTTAWSLYPLDTVKFSVLQAGVTLVSISIAVALPLPLLVDALILAFQWIIASSYLLEAVVALFHEGPLAPPVLWGKGPLPASSYWIDGRLFEGGPIQGFPGNRNPLAFIALLMGVCLVLRWMQTRSRTLSTVLWGLAGLAVFPLTGSATVVLSALGCAIAIGVLVICRRVEPSKRLSLVGVFAGMAGVGALGVFFARHWVADFFGRSPDMSGRSVIWHAVMRLVRERPTGGWGWTIGWATYMEPFKSLVVRGDGTSTNQSHNVYVEAALLTGVIGLLIISFAVVWTTYRLIKVAVAHIDDNLLDVIPAVLMIAMVIQSFTESRMLSEGNWMLFVVISTWVKVRGEVPFVWPSAAREHLEYA